MFLKEVSMDGFKCYVDKISVKNMDKNFNAITGMNGSGKSNIIDAIIFALDLNTSKYMRVSNLKELINIHRKECMVSLIFDNTHKERSPSGYESYDYIEISRSLDHESKSKYKLNGHNATKNSIESFCKSIGATNNFIVMQGHITKIVNMKSTDLKNMIEETAGTRNYNQEREKSLETLSKKEFKLKEAREHLKKTISPFFEQLKREKKIYQENKDFELNRKAFIEELACLEAKVAISDYSNKISELLNMGEQYFTQQSELNSLEQEIKSSTTSDGTEKIDFDSKLNYEKGLLAELRSNDYESLLKEKEAEKSRNLKILENTPDVDLKDLKERELFLSREFLSVADSNKLTELESLKKFICKKETELNILSFDMQQKIKNFNELANMKEQDISEFLSRCQRELQEAKKQVEVLDPELFQLKSKIIYPIIDGVYGTVDENFTFRDERFKEAILTILGGRAKYIITRDEEVASKILQGSDRKVSCIPLTKISYSEPINVSYNCVNALNAISYDKKYERAFKHIFNSFYIFENKKDASDCCFKHNVLCVTLDGNVYDPKGTLTGGKASYKYQVTRLSDVLEIENRLNIYRQVISNNSRFIQLNKLFGERESIIADLSKYREKAELIKKMCGSNVDLRKEIESLRNQIVEYSKIDTIRNKAAGCLEKLEDEIKDIKQKKALAAAKIERCIDSIKDIENQQIEWRARENQRKASIRMFECLDERRKILIKTTVKLYSRMNRLYEEINTHEKDLHKNVQFLIERDSFVPQYNDVYAYCQSSIESKENSTNFNIFDELCKKFNLNSVLNLPLNFIPQNQRDEIETQIADLKSKINQKRILISMDPTNFELLEKNSVSIQTLEKKIEKLETDRMEIIRSIERLNEIGKEENKRALDHINKVLRIFLGYFIPNSDVLLTEDYQIKVKIGSWKNSLSELSGGQKSLIALCLIFSMLNFKPAPFYIFDEIDAALDLNYTQGIGEIIKNEFKGAQFIIVSLKNNMFDNANRIYKVFIQDHRPKICLLK